MHGCRCRFVRALRGHMRIGRSRHGAATGCVFTRWRTFLPDDVRRPARGSPDRCRSCVDGEARVLGGRPLHARILGRGRPAGGAGCGRSPSSARRLLRRSGRRGARRGRGGHGGRALRLRLRLGRRPRALLHSVRKQRHACRPDGGGRVLLPLARRRRRRLELARRRGRGRGRRLVEGPDATRPNLGRPVPPPSFSRPPPPPLPVRCSRRCLRKRRRLS